MEGAHLGTSQEAYASGSQLLRLLQHAFTMLTLSLSQLMRRAMAGGSTVRRALILLHLPRNDINMTSREKALA
ncbi:hypothetical protein C206_29488 [Pseudomonas putida TRO1]|uniref:Uncharacterized protein n=1 Tax=Pseudomonas putida TRO1 TaxID=1227924 RepID=A0AAD2W515_PSEPU|nr:hypothetical protein C206_29488 [Pseudomonas putida TRO1]